MTIKHKKFTKEIWLYILLLVHLSINKYAESIGSLLLNSLFLNLILDLSESNYRGTGCVNGARPKRKCTHEHDYNMDV